MGQIESYEKRKHNFHCTFYCIGIRHEYVIVVEIWEGEKENVEEQTWNTHICTIETLLIQMW